MNYARASLLNTMCLLSRPESTSFLSWKSFPNMAPFRSTIDHAHRYLHLAKAKRALLLEASMTLVLVRVCLMLFPFRLIAARLGTAVSPNDALVRTSL